MLRRGTAQRGFALPAPDGGEAVRKHETAEKTWQQTIYALLFLAAVLILFLIYTTQNRARIQEQNRIYAEDCARQMAERIESEFDNALQRIQNSAYLVSADEGSLEIDAGLLREMEENTTFDAIRFTSADGLNLASTGETNDSSDRDYFVRGMRGESGAETIAESGITGKPMMVFYAPVYQGKEIAGMFLGLYFAESYLQDMVSASYFGEAADVFLCSQEGKVIASSGGGGYGGDLIDSLIKSGVIDSGTAEKARTVFADGGEVALLCSKGCKTDNLCVVDLPGYEYVLVQAFPQTITQAMVKRANMAGVRLEICLIVLFAVYIAFLAIHAGRQRKKLERENRLISDVLRGTNIIFSSRYLMVDLEEGCYSYMAGIGPLNTNIPMTGVYDEMIKTHAEDIIGEDGKKRFWTSVRPIHSGRPCPPATRPFMNAMYPARGRRTGSI